MSNALTEIKSLVQQESVQGRLDSMLGENAGVFTNSIINLVSGNAQLQKCTPATIMAAAMRAASVKLPIDPALGFAAIVPYGNSANFQMMYRGYIQLAIRSGHYESMHDTEVYHDELKSHNRMTGETLFTDQSMHQMYKTKKLKDVAGFYCQFKLKTGFKHSLFMTMDEVMAHAKKFSKAYQYDLAKKKKTSIWSTDPVPMGRKTVIILALHRYGIMSVEMQTAMRHDQEGFEGAQAAAQENIDDTMGRKKRKVKSKTVETEKETADVEQTSQEKPEDWAEGL